MLELLIILYLMSQFKKNNNIFACLQVAKEFGFNSNSFSVYLNRNKTGEILSQNKSLSLLKIK